MTELKPNDIISVGYKPNVDIHLLCNENGMKYIPEYIKADKPYSAYRNVFIALTKENLVKLSLCGVSRNDIKAMLKTIPKEC